MLRSIVIRLPASASVPHRTIRWTSSAAAPINSTQSKSNTYSRSSDTTTKANTTTTNNNTTIAALAAAADQAKIQAESDSDSLAPLPYHVYRTPSIQLPVYHLAKRGGNLHQTRIRKISGDIKALRDDLVYELNLKRENVVIQPLTGHIILKGWYKDQVKRFLEAKRF